MWLWTKILLTTTIFLTVNEEGRLDDILESNHEAMILILSLGHLYFIKMSAFMLEDTCLWNLTPQLYKDLQDFVLGFKVCLFFNPKFNYNIRLGK